jgi:aminoglycoside phosphotransferase (APT) family kinase protein
MRARFQGFVTVEPVTLHNDLHWNQLRIRQRRYALLDLERLCVGDPLVDAANFATQLRMLGQRPEHQVTPQEASHWAAEFLEQWVTATKTPIASDRFRTYAALTLLELARSMMRHFRPGWRALAHHCVAQAESELNTIGQEAVVS